MRILVVVNIYYPDMELLKHGIESYCQEVDHILIWDNTPSGESIKDRLDLVSDKLEYIGNGKNTGFSESLNFTLRYAVKNDYDYIMTMDQDSVWVDFKWFKIAAEKLNCQGVCLTGPASIKPGGVRSEKRGTEEARWLITSGMLIPVTLAEDVGGFSNEFFMDCNDIEFCLRAETEGYHCYMNYDGIMEHKVGEPLEKIICGKKVRTVYYSSFRINEMIKNHIILYRQYHHPELKKEIWNLFKMHIGAIVFIKGKRIERLMALLKGVCQGMVQTIS